MSDVYQAQPVPASPPQVSGMAKASMAFGIAPWFCCCGTSAALMILTLATGAGGSFQGTMAKMAGYQAISAVLSCCFMLMALLAVILGVVSLSRIGHSDGMLGGKGYAWTGIIGGGLYLLIIILLILVGLIAGLTGATFLAPIFSKLRPGA
ncbi:MAG: hypothetical protein ACP5VF_02095 [Acidobacteriota bacterium]